MAQGLPWGKLRDPARSVCFFVLFYLCIWLWVEPVLIYHAPGITMGVPVFFLGWGFFKAFLTYPGGPVGYLAALLSQYYYYSWAGALVITLVVWLLCLATDVFISFVAGVRFRVLKFVPAILFLVLYNQYANPLGAGLAVLVALLFLIAYMRIEAGAGALRMMVFLLLSALVYYTAGGAYLLFALFAAVLDFLNRRPLPGLFCLVLGFTLPYLTGTYVFGQRIDDAYLRLLSFHRDADTRTLVVLVCLYIFFPLVAVVGWASQALARFGAALWRVLLVSRWVVFRGTNATTPIRPVMPTSFQTPKLVGSFRRRWLGWLCESLVLFVLVGVCVYFSFESVLKMRLQIEYYGRQGKWARVLQVARQLPLQRYDVYIGWDVNRALYHTGQLSSEMFSYPQQPRSILPSAEQFAPMPSVVMVKLADILFELDNANEAEHAACEAAAFLGERSFVLQRLFRILVAKNQPQAARTYLGILSKDLIYGKWASKRLAGPETVPGPLPGKGDKSTSPAPPDRVNAGSFSAEEMLLDLLQANRHNRMAFEYLMAYYLMNHKLEKFVKNIGRLDDFDYPRIPRHYEEALAVYQHQTGKQVPLQGRRISSETLDRFRGFSELANLYSHGMQGIWQVLLKDYGNSYFLYSHYGPR